MQDHGFDVYSPGPEASWVYFTNADGIGYAQYNSFKLYDVSTVHKPHISCGTGYRIHSDIGRPTPEMLRNVCRMGRPHWAPMRDEVRKFKNIEDYRSYSDWNARLKKIPKRAARSPL